MVDEKLKKVFNEQKITNFIEAVSFLNVTGCYSEVEVIINSLAHFPDNNINDYVICVVKRHYNSNDISLFKLDTESPYYPYLFFCLENGYIDRVKKIIPDIQRIEILGIADVDYGFLIHNYKGTVIVSHSDNIDAEVDARNHRHLNGAEGVEPAAPIGGVFEEDLEVGTEAEMEPFEDPIAPRPTIRDEEPQPTQPANAYVDYDTPEDMVDAIRAMLNRIDDIRNRLGREQMDVESQITNVTNDYDYDHRLAEMARQYGVSLNTLRNMSVAQVRELDNRVRDVRERQDRMRRAIEDRE